MAGPRGTVRRAALALAVLTGCLVSLVPPASSPAAATTLGITLPLAVATSTTGILPGAVHRTSLAIDATYDADVRLSFRTRVLAGSVVIRATNASGAGIDRLELNTVMARIGQLRLGAVTVDGEEVDARVEDQTIVVPLGGILPDRGATTLVVPFEATLGEDLAGSHWLFTRTAGVVNLYRWLPWISRATPFDRPNHGDPFVTPVAARVTATLRTDVPLRFAGTGTRTAVSDDGLVQTIAATDVRDLVLTAAEDYRWLDRTVGDTHVRIATRAASPLSAAAMLRAASLALPRMERLLGAYPYPTLTIAESAGGYGMEGPAAVWIPRGTPSDNLSYLVTHEIAHQWFYGLVGNDQARDPFADEAAADLVARTVLGSLRASRCAQDDLDRKIYAYTARCYYETVYIQGANLLDGARRKMGTERFWDAMRAYVADHRFAISSTNALLAALDAATPVDLVAWWRARFPTRY